MYRLIVGLALRKHVPRRPDVANPQHGFQGHSRRDQLVTGVAAWNVFFRKMLPNPFPFAVAQTQYEALGR
ncbi:MAG: hypothetical protein OJF47_000299 [Nitrospira sp.]|nr:MAG: hypothetical protein OJF47_000299 [Nitrospira sp.]